MLDLFEVDWKTFTLTREPETPKGRVGGRFSWFIPHDEVEEYVPGLLNYYPWSNVAIKIFKAPYRCITEFTWGSNAELEGSETPLLESTKIQNAFHYYNLAPRVWDIIYLEGPDRKYVARVAEEVKGFRSISRELCKWYLRSMEYLAEELGVEIGCYDYAGLNLIGFKWVDYQGFRYRDPELVRQRLIDRANRVTAWGPSPAPYQSITPLEHKGARDIKHRIERLGLDQIDFKDKTVLDVGCNAGMMASYASAKGARLVVGIDMPEVTRLAQDIANFLGIFNVDFFAHDLQDAKIADVIRERTKVGAFDIVFYLAMLNHIGYPAYLDKLVGDVMYVEGHGETDATAPEMISKFQQYFSEVIPLGFTTDCFNRATVKCIR